MKNNKGFGKTEVMILLLLAIVLFAGGAYMILGGANNQKYNTMKENGWNFSKTVATNIASFHYSQTVYLGEAIDEGLFKDMKNPFGKGNCSESESRIDTVDGKPYVTFKCGDYLIDHSTFDDRTIVPIYKVGKWQEEKLEGENVEEKTLYNCLDGGDELFDEYNEELYMVYLYNKEYGADAYFSKDMTMCEVVTKTFYRTKEKVA